MIPKAICSHSRNGAALVLVLAMIVIMTGLVITVFVSVSGERRAAAVKIQGTSASQLASSAPQLVISQIQDAATSGNPWASQPGMVRTYGPTGAAAHVYKLYSAARMSEGGDFSESEDAPLVNWKDGKNSAIYCDINLPVSTASGSLSYPVVDPSAAATSFTVSGTETVPGFRREQDATPGFDKGRAPSPENNPLPMPVRWLYILKNGEMAVPNSVQTDGLVRFSPDATTPTRENPVVGRLAFWADDDTCKVNINTAGYARNDSAYWTYWDTPVGQTQDELNRLNWAQPWTNEYQRYPGHPASTGLNVVFDSLNLTDKQILSLTPRFNPGGTQGGSVISTTPPTSGSIGALVKDERLFSTVDEMFYNEGRGANAAGISRQDLEARRFLLTATSRAPEITLWNTPRTTIWPTWQTTSKRTPIDKLIAFCSTTAGQPFYFVRESPLSTRELLDFPQNLTLWKYLQSLSNQAVPGFGGDFGTKYGTGSGIQSRDQILTSIFDAIRLANLDDRTGPGAGNTSGWSFTAGNLKLAGTSWIPTTLPYVGGYVAPTDGPVTTSGTHHGAGRTGALAEVTIAFARKTPDDWDTKPDKNPADPNYPTVVRTISETQKDADGFMPVDRVNAAFFFGFFTPTAGMVQPGQSRRIKVTGLDTFYVMDDEVKETDKDGKESVKKQYLFPSGYTYDWTQIDKSDVSRRDFGGKLDWSLSMKDAPAMFFDRLPYTSGTHKLVYGPPTAIVTLPYYTYNSATDKGSENRSKQFNFSGGTVNIELYSPAGAAEPYQKYEVNFPAATPLTPMMLYNRITTSVPKNYKDPSQQRTSWTQSAINFPWDALSGDGRFPVQTGTFNPANNTPATYYDQRISFAGDTVLGMHSKTCAFAWEVLRSDTIKDFQPHFRYFRTADNGDMSGLTLPAGTTLDKLTRRASMMKWAVSNTIPQTAPSPVFDILFGKLFSDFNNYASFLTPVVPCSSSSSVEKTYPTCDFSNGPGPAPEGSLSPKTDEGAKLLDGTLQSDSPYFRNTNTASHDLAQATLSSPNRQMPSAIYFGSIPTAPWRTLLFRPARAYHSGGTAHFGAASPPDYLMLDWFHMPIVEPYAISEPFSTAGKINLNSRIMPFGDYLRRETGLRAVLRSARIPVVPKSVVSDLIYSGASGLGTGALSTNTRIPIDEEETLKAIRERFEGTDGSNKRVYLTDAEICSVDLIPKGYTKSSLSSFWQDNLTTGDNLREGAYSSILPRLTARSNTYTVHVTAQTLQTTEADGGWREGKGIVAAEWRGSFGIERYIDPNDARFAGASAPNFLSGTVSVEPYYKFRILGEKRFDP